jgi:hypothetical protein
MTFSNDAALNLFVTQKLNAHENNQYKKFDKNVKKFVFIALHTFPRLSFVPILISTHPVLRPTVFFLSSAFLYLQIRVLLS